MNERFRFHHMGIPTTVQLPDRAYNEDLKIHGIGYFERPYGVEWHNFDADNDLPEVIKTKPHTAYVVDDLERALKGKNVIVEPTNPADGVTVAFIFDCGMAIELIQFDKPEQEVWPHPKKFEI